MPSSSESSINSIRLSGAFQTLPDGHQASVKGAGGYWNHAY